MRLLLTILFVFFLFVQHDFAQTCSPPPIILNSKAENMFSPEQEMFLGDAMNERLVKEFRVIEEPRINDYVQAIGDRISRHLPESGIRFRFVVIDSNDTNAYAMAGGRIYVTRKLVSFVKSEDELAGVIGHELGHAVVRHHAIDMTKYFKQLLGINSVGDRRDVFENYNRFLETFRTKRVKFSGNHEDGQQIEADRIGLFASYAAGYDPNALTDFWKRLTNAKKGNFFSDLFGSKTPADKRLREMIAAMKQISATCVDTRPDSAKAEFEAWRSFTINYSGLGSTESLTGLIMRQKLEPLRADIDHFRFSPNGEYLIAQDNSTVTLLRREPLSVQFRFDVEGAFPAEFSADSSNIVVYNKNLRVEKWSVKGQKLLSSHEIAIRGGYWQTRISPDGNYIVSYRWDGSLVVYDVATNEEIFKEKDFYMPDIVEYLRWRILTDLLDLDEYPAINIEFSPDGKYVLAGRKNRSNFGPQHKETIAIDLAARKTISIGDNVKKVLVSSLDFLGPDKIIGQYGKDIKKSGIFAFPSGERIEQFDLAGASFTAAAAGDYITVRPVVGAAVGLFDLKQKKYLFGNKKSALDVFDDVFVAERRNGEVSIFSLATKQSTSAISLPASPFGSLRTSAVSTDGNWLTVSDRSRGAAWNLNTGERLLHIRGFRGAYFAPDGRIFADFPKEGEIERSIAVMDLRKNTVEAVGDVEKRQGNTRQHGPYIVVRKALKEKEEKPDRYEGKRAYVEEEREKIVPFKETEMHVRTVQTGELLWSRQFPDETPRYAINVVHDTMLLSWPLASAAAKHIINEDRSLKERAGEMGDKEGDRLIQFLDPKTGKVTGHFFLESGEGSLRAEQMYQAKDFLVIGDDANRILLYSISTGKLVGRFFGNYSAVSPTLPIVAVENVPGRVTVYDIVSGDEIANLSFTRPIAMMRFMADGKKLFVLTDDQTAFMFDSSKFGTAVDGDGKLALASIQ